MLFQASGFLIDDKLSPTEANWGFLTIIYTTLLIRKDIFTNNTTCIYHQNTQTEKIHPPKKVAQAKIPAPQNPPPPKQQKIKEDEASTKFPHRIPLLNHGTNSQVMFAWISFNATFPRENTVDEANEWYNRWQTFKDREGSGWRCFQGSGIWLKQNIIFMCHETLHH